MEQRFKIQGSVGELLVKNPLLSYLLLGAIGLLVALIAYRLLPLDRGVTVSFTRHSRFIPINGIAFWLILLATCSAAPLWRSLWLRLR